MTTNNEAFEEFISKKYWSEMQVYAATESYKFATTEANKREAELESIMEEQKLIISGLKGECQDLGVTDICIALSRKDTQISELQANNNTLREALHLVNEHSKLWGFKIAGNVQTEIDAALSATPAESLQAHEAELKEKILTAKLNENVMYVENDALKSRINTLRKALENIIKSDENIYNCEDDYQGDKISNLADIHFKAYYKARKLLEKTPAESLQAHDDMKGK